MKQEFEMTQQNMDDIIAINKNMPPVMKMGDKWSGLDLEERVNAYWEKMGNDMGFKHMTVEPSSKGSLFFIAEVKPIVVPKTRSEIEIDRYIGDSTGYMNHNVVQSLKKIVAQLESCNYECEAGTLNTNVAFLALKQMSN